MTTEESRPLRMHAYYYAFEPTGVPEIDKILSAVASAGKAYHNTEWWNEDGEDGPGEWAPFRGGSCVEWIQNAANDAADEMRRRPNA